MHYIILYGNPTNTLHYAWIIIILLHYSVYINLLRGMDIDKNPFNLYLYRQGGKEEHARAMAPDIIIRAKNFITRVLDRLSPL